MKQKLLRSLFTLSAAIAICIGTDHIKADAKIYYRLPLDGITIDYENQMLTVTESPE